MVVIWLALKGGWFINSVVMRKVVWKKVEEENEKDTEAKREPLLCELRYGCLWA